MNNRLFFGAATAAMLLAGTASAQTWYNPTNWLQGGQWYVGADGGYHFPEALKGQSTRVGSDGLRQTWRFGSDDNNWSAFAKAVTSFRPASAWNWNMVTATAI